MPLPSPKAADADSEASITVVWLHPDAPAKPLEGARCNGCGLCCLTEPCPLGAIVSRRRTGACKALRWSDEDRRYWCGMVSDPGSVTGLTHRWAVRVLAALARRWIASGVGCDAQLQTQVVPSHALSSPSPPSPPPPPPVAPPLPPTSP